MFQKSPADPAENKTETKQVSDFITLQSPGNFSIMTAVITTLWELLQRLTWSGFASTWWPLALCVLFGLASLRSSRLEGLWAWVSAIIITAFNTALLFGAVIGAAEGVTAIV